MQYSICTMFTIILSFMIKRIYLGMISLVNRWRHFWPLIVSKIIINFCSTFLFTFSLHIARFVGRITLRKCACLRIFIDHIFRRYERLVTAFTFVQVLTGNGLGFYGVRFTRYWLIDLLEVFILPLKEEMPSHTLGTVLLNER